MFNISLNNQITISRGDDASCSLLINAGTLCDISKYVLQPGERVYFSVVENNYSNSSAFTEFNNGLIRKELTCLDVNDNNEVVIHFYSTDTESLLPGTYRYSIKVKKNDNTINTIIDKAKFIIVE